MGCVLGNQPGFVQLPKQASTICSQQVWKGGEAVLLLYMVRFVGCLGMDSVVCHNIEIKKPWLQGTVW